MARPVGPDGARVRVLTTKLTEPEARAWDALLDEIGAAGPRPREADVLRWLIREEVRRRGRAWPGDGPPAAVAADAAKRRRR